LHVRFDGFRIKKKRSVTALIRESVEPGVFLMNVSRCHAAQDSQAWRAYARPWRHGGVLFVLLAAMAADLDGEQGGGR